MERIDSGDCFQDRRSQAGRLTWRLNQLRKKTQLRRMGFAIVGTRDELSESRLIEIVHALPALKGVLMELQDCAFPLL
jgi:hypothetical protein